MYLSPCKFLSKSDLTQPSYGRNHFCWANYFLIFHVFWANYLQGHLFGNHGKQKSINSKHWQTCTRMCKYVQNAQNWGKFVKACKTYKVVPPWVTSISLNLLDFTSTYHNQNPITTTYINLPYLIFVTDATIYYIRDAIHRVFFLTGPPLFSTEKKIGQRANQRLS